MAKNCAGWTHKDGTSLACQFADVVDDQEFNGESFCEFHLPMGEPGQGGKSDWNEGMKAVISNEIIRRIDVEMSRPQNERNLLDFSGVVVPGNLNLKMKTIGSISFLGAQFREVVILDAAQFHEDAVFDTAKFNRTASFREVHFRKDAIFDATQFHDHAWFNATQFNGDATYRGARFKKFAMFGAAHFYRNATFTATSFHGFTMFGTAVFHQNAMFDEAKFHMDATFQSAQFRGDVVIFEAAQFLGRSLFAGNPNTAQVEARAFNYADFGGVRFGTEADFSNRQFHGHTNFTDAVFQQAPNFHGSTLHQDTAFGGIDCFPDVTSDGADRAYRTLRQAMEGHRARPEEGMFYALEQKARRHLMKRFDPAFLTSLAYELGSNYGLSVLRPVAWFVGGIFASAFLLLVVGVFGGAGGADADLAAKWTDSLLFSARQTFVPFDALRTSPETLSKLAFNPGGAGWLRAWGVFLTLFEALAALLLVLAVRWRYRR